MDLFTLDRYSYRYGQIIPDTSDISWIERYDTAGEFEFKMPNTPYNVATYGPDTMVSHIGSKYVGMVEYITIEKKEGEEEPSAVFHGRMVDTIGMENRIVTMNETSPPPFSSSPILWQGPMYYEFVSGTGDVWDQLREMMHVTMVDNFINVKENYPNLRILTTVPGTDPNATMKSIDGFEYLSTAVYSRLAEAELGLKVERPNADHDTLDFIIHIGEDKTASVIFDYASGEIADAQYLISNVNYKNGSYVKGQDDNYSQQLPTSGFFDAGWDLRMTITEATDFEPFVSVPATWSSGLRNRAKADLLKKKRDYIMGATINPNSKYKFGVDYDIGDLVYVVGEYDISSVMRVTEYAITSDSSGESGFPTLSAL